MPRPIAIVLAAALSMLAACSSHPPVHFSSEPAGARILIDGKDTGFVTPTILNVPDKRSRLVEFVLPGYEVEARDMRNGKRREYIFYQDWTLHYKTWRFPLWLNFQDFFVERKTLKGERPNRFFVEMKRKGSAG